MNSGVNVGGWTQDRAAWVQAPAGVITLCSRTRLFTLRAPLSTRGPVVQRVDNAIQLISVDKQTALSPGE